MQDLKLFANYTFANLDLPEATRLEYTQRVIPFLRYVQINGLSGDCFLNYKRSLTTRTDIGVSCKNKYLTTARTLLKELHRIGKLQTDITENVRSFRQAKKHKRTGFSQNEVEKIFKYVSTLPNIKRVRMRAILSLLVIQGLRQIEIVRLNVCDIDLVGKTALILGKGCDDQELVDLHPLTVKALREYFSLHKVADGVVFQSESNNSSGRRLTTRGLRQIVSELLKLIGLNKNIHGFRHYFVTRLIESYKGDLLEVRRYTRHRSLEMLQVYCDRKKTQDLLNQYYCSFDNSLFAY